MGWNASTKGARELQRLAVQIKEAGGDGSMLRRFRREIREAGAPCVADLRAAVMAVKVTRGVDEHSRRWDGGRFVLRDDLPKRKPGRWGRRSTGLRARVSGAVGISQTRKGVRIRVSAQRVGDYGNTLPRYLDGSLPKSKNWRHPLFGNREIWVTQHGSPWFFNTIDRHRASFRKAVFDVMEQTKQDLSR